MNRKKRFMRRGVLAILLMCFSGVILFGTVLIVCTSVTATLVQPIHTRETRGTQTQSVMSPTLLPTAPSVLTVVGVPPTIYAKAAYLLDMDSGNTLYDVHGEKPLPMASTTKTMTALVVLQSANLQQKVTIDADLPAYVSEHNGSNANLIPGDRLTVNDLLYALMLPSGDDAAIMLARAIAGTQDAFVARMNRFALRYHLFQTHYINPDGLTYYDSAGRPLPGHTSSAYDLTRLTDYALHIPLFAKIVKTKTYDLSQTDEHGVYHWTNTNHLLDLYPNATGVKTGFTDEAGYCLIFSGQRNGHHLVGTVLFSSNTDAEQRFRDAKTLLEWGLGLPVLPAYTTDEQR